MRARATGSRAGQDEPLDPVGRGERQLLGDHAAEARPEHVGPLDAGLVEDLQRVAGHGLRRVRAGRRLAGADAPVVEEQHLERAREERHDRLPTPARVPEALDQEQRRPLADAFPGDPDAHTPASACSCRPTADSIRRRARARPRAEIPTMPPGKK